MEYFAHSSPEQKKDEWHRLKQHLEDTAQLAASFAERFGAQKLGYLAGLLHDVGKYSPEFQKRLHGDKSKVDHSTAGAMVAEEHYKTYGKMLAYVIAGHHCGLPDWGSEVDEASLAGRLRKTCLPEYSAYKQEITLLRSEELVFPINKAPVGRGFSVQLFIRFLYSSLVDADFMDTERALNNQKYQLRGTPVSLVDMQAALDKFLAKKCRNADDTPVNRHRKKILDDCRDKADESRGLFTLTVPTGGGKTLSTMAFALKHGIKHSMDRIIYVIPYTSIIEQNAAVFREIFGEAKVLEHHSNFTGLDETLADIETEFTNNIAQKLKLATENWDMPIVVTTNVQFFESLFSAKSSRCRKLHNIANSVVIIDEAQMIPTGFLRPCINGLIELVANYNTTVVMCTATQPAINKFIPSEIKVVEIMSDPEELYSALQRVQVTHLGELSDEALINRLLEQDQVLCVVNSKKHARLIFEKIQGEGAFHLSTRMCPVHRSEILKTVRKRLAEGKSCRVVSTQLIEAGVDVDFPVVYRSQAGVDSIAQAAGRCNREGLRQTGEVFVFIPEKHGLPAGWLSRTAAIGESVFSRCQDPLSLEGVKDYFTELYNIEGEELDKQRIMVEIQEQEGRLNFPFRKLDDKLKLIDDNTIAVVIPWDEGCRKLLEEAKESQFPGKYARRLQKYTVQVYEQELKEMLRFRIIESVAGNFYALGMDAFELNYSQDMGLLPCTESMLLNDILII